MKNFVAEISGPDITAIFDWDTFIVLLKNMLFVTSQRRLKNIDI